MTKLEGVLPCPLTLSGFLNGTSVGVVQTLECVDGSDGPILLRAITRKV